MFRDLPPTGTRPVHQDEIGAEDPLAAVLLQLETAIAEFGQSVHDLTQSVTDLRQQCVESRTDWAVLRAELQQTRELLRAYRLRHQAERRSGAVGRRRQRPCDQQVIIRGALRAEALRGLARHAAPPGLEPGVQNVLEGEPQVDEDALCLLESGPRRLASSRHRRTGAGSSQSRTRPHPRAATPVGGCCRSAPDPIGSPPAVERHSSPRGAPRARPQPTSRSYTRTALPTGSRQRGHAVVVPQTLLRAALRHRKVRVLLRVDVHALDGTARVRRTIRRTPFLPAARQVPAPSSPPKRRSRPPGAPGSSVASVLALMFGLSGPTVSNVQRGIYYTTSTPAAAAS